MKTWDVIVIGGGAAGCFAAIHARIHHPEASVLLLEKTSKLLAKVRISGGGRCNVTHACFQLSELVKHYPRGGKGLKKLLGQFMTTDTIDWFESRNVPLKTEADNRMFPQSDNSASIADCLLTEMNRLGVVIRQQTPVLALKTQETGFVLELARAESLRAKKVIVASGGSPKRAGLQWLADLGHRIEEPVPSLFTFNMPNEPIRELMGVVAANASVAIQGTKLQSAGPLLITHWGMSGPAVLRLSAFGARMLAERQYQFTVRVHWCADQTEDDLRQQWIEIGQKSRGQVAGKSPIAGIPNRLWNHLCEKAGVQTWATWDTLGKKDRNRLIDRVVNDTYTVSGKTTFKEEFVTCGGVSLQDVSLETMQSRVVHGLYFAGEVLDIDGVTGGFNFQAAWAGGFVAGKLG